MKKWMLIVFWTLGLGAVFLLMSFASQRYESLLWEETKIRWPAQPKRTFITSAEVQAILEEMWPADSSYRIKEINTQLLEEKLGNHPSIKQSEVYWDLKGVLWLKVWQHQPLARIQGGEEPHYLLAQGGKMPLSPHYSASVPLISGSIPDSLRPHLAQFCRARQSDSIFANFFAGIHVRPDGQWILHPQMGALKILLGHPQNIEHKLRKLRIYYRRGLTSKKLHQLKTIDLRYGDQVICR